MKVMTCKQLGGACDLEFRADSFDEIAKMSKAHGSEMFEKQDQEHLKAMLEMGELMKDPAKMQAWFNERKAEFDALPEVD